MGEQEEEREEGQGRQARNNGDGERWGSLALCKPKSLMLAAPARASDHSNFHPSL